MALNEGKKMETRHSKTTIERDNVAAMAATLVPAFGETMTPTNAPTNAPTICPCNLRYFL
ncbi:hypothetical protein CBM2586_B10277 [Cupriavidus phytorum]|uniref:Uncharacterized protein n=1 Tax=Cupriavidus taiwanensis TaxID=164546 RepID=A0A375C9A1_9BURK|nr:hypothetical protein CBM2586_B10277 [Cupriavidus taiwanensis]